MALRRLATPLLAQRGAFPSGGVRSMAGAMGVHKNKFVEEWSGRREVSERTFDIGVEWPGLIAKLVIPTGIMYYYIKAEQVRTNSVPIPGLDEFTKLGPARLLLHHLTLSRSTSLSFSARKRCLTYL